MPSPSELAATVNENIVTVRNEKQKAVEGLRSQWFGGEAATNATNAINSLTARIETWAAKGIVGAATGKAPYTTGWAGWVKDGRNFINGIHDIYSVGDKATLKNIATTIKEAPKQAAKDIAAGAQAVAGVVGGTASALVKPMLLPLVVLVAAAIALVFTLKHAKVIG